ncbi:MAG TPA: hypothetical protein V6D08_11105 [Candidatus Obscuribacterales bacterium]
MGIILWAFAIAIGSLPLFFEALLYVPFSRSIRYVYDMHYKELVVYMLVVTGVGLGDAVEASRRADKDSWDARLATVTSLVLSLLAFVVAMSFALHLSPNFLRHLIPTIQLPTPLSVPKLWLDFFAACIVFAFVGKIFSERTI